MIAQNEEKSGYLLIDKPEGITSHDVVDKLRRTTGVQRIGHAGTLDPFASGLLIVGIGRTATRELGRLIGLDKVYEAVFAFGGQSDTDDRTGKIEILNDKFQIPKEKQFTELLKKFTGTLQQMPSRYSAVKVGGQKSYAAARRGQTLPLTPRRIKIFEISQLPHPLTHSSTHPLTLVPLRIHCSSGTYIRALARDIGEALKSGGYAQELRRTNIGPFSIKHAVNLDNLSPGNWRGHLIPVETALKQALVKPG